MPVVDKESRLVGIVTIDDAIDVMEEEATLMASDTVMSRFRSTNSVVMIDPAESSGYWRISLTLRRCYGGGGHGGL